MTWTRNDKNAGHCQNALSEAEETGARTNALADQLQAQIDTLQRQQLELESHSSAEQGLREQIREVQSQLDATSRERDAFVHRLEESKEDVKLIAELQDLLQNQQEESREKTEEISGLAGQLKALQETLDQEQAAILEQERTIERLSDEVATREEELNSLRHERDDAKDQIEDARYSQSKLESQLKHVEQLLNQRDDAISRANKLEQQLAESQIRIEGLSEELESYNQETHMLQNSHEEAKLELKQENDVLRKKLADLAQEHEAVSQVLIDERTRLSSMESENHRLAVLAQEADESAAKTNEELRTNLARRQVEMDTLRSELEDIASQLSRERHQREHLQNVVQEKNKECTQSEELRTDLEGKVASLESKNESLITQAAELLSLRGEHAVAQQKIVALAQEVETFRGGTDEEKLAMSKRIDELNRQISQLTSQLAQVRVEREDQISELERLQQVHRTTLAGRMELESAKDKIEQEFRELRGELDSVQDVESRNRELEQQIAEIQSSLDQNRATEQQVHDLEHQIAQLQMDLDEAREMESVVVDLRSRLDRVIAQRDEAMQSQAEQVQAVQELQQRISENEESYALLRERFDTLQEDANESEELRESLMTMQTQATETADRLRRVTVERDSQRDALRNAEDRLIRLETSARQNEETIRKLRLERAATIESQSPATVSYGALASQSMPETDLGGRLRRDEVLGLVYTQPPKRKDDLKRISGIAQVLEKKLNAFGVYTYRQIMEWDEVAIAEFSKLLSFRDRIERDDWTGQARNLQYETYGRAA